MSLEELRRSELFWQRASLLSRKEDGRPPFSLLKNSHSFTMTQLKPGSSLCTAGWLSSVFSLSDARERSWDDLGRGMQGRPESLSSGGGHRELYVLNLAPTQCKGGWLLGSSLSSDGWK